MNKRNENQWELNPVSMKDVEAPLLQIIFSWACWPAVVENEGDFIFMMKEFKLTLFLSPLFHGVHFLRRQLLHNEHTHTHTYTHTHTHIYIYIYVKKQSRPKVMNLLSRKRMFFLCLHISSIISYILLNNHRYSFNTSCHLLKS